MRWAFENIHTYVYLNTVVKNVDEIWGKMEQKCYKQE